MRSGQVAHEANAAAAAAALNLLTESDDMILGIISVGNVSCWPENRNSRVPG